LTKTINYSPWFEQAIQNGINFARIRSELDSGFERLIANPQFNPHAAISMTGSGDSLFAAMCAIPALQRWAGLNASAHTSMEFARYRLPLLGRKDTVWAISNSGSAARTRETVSLAKSMGLLAVGITGSDTGPLASAADTYIFRPLEDLPQILAHNRGIFMNMNEFLVTLYTLFHVGLRLGVLNNAIRQHTAQDILIQCEKAIKSVGSIAATIEQTAVDAAADLKNLDTLWVIGAGPSLGTARYCAAKFHEQLPWNGIPEDLEEWAHLQYFLTLTWKSRSAVIVLAPPGNSLDRAEELVEGIADAGGRAYVVTHPGGGSFSSAEKVFRIDGEKNEFLSPFTYHLPAQLLVMHVSRLLGGDPSALRRADNYKLIRHGAILTDSSKLA
jgi:glucosamine--fructose-6-phosphate aminotransferase (isomerizing)